MKIFALIIAVMIGSIFVVALIMAIWKVSPLLIVTLFGIGIYLLLRK